MDKQNWVFISLNYRLVPEVSVQQQTQDIAEALIYIQKQAANWHADPKRLVLMGHSAGAHLVSLLTTRPLWLTSQPQPWRATVALDSAAYNVEIIMQTRHARFYDQAFGNQPSNWKALLLYLKYTKLYRHFSLFVPQFGQTNHVYRHSNLFSKHKNQEPKPSYCLFHFHTEKSTSHLGKIIHIPKR
ncbi:alpha/beta hydrolase [Acinetobacter haemolyticus]|nr:alpha/beta hydrolase [Acinetobacter haemolyticus]